MAVLPVYGAGAVLVAVLRLAREFSPCLRQSFQGARVLALALGLVLGVVALQHGIALERSALIRAGWPVVSCIVRYSGNLGRAGHPDRWRALLHDHAQWSPYMALPGLPVPGRGLGALLHLTFRTPRRAVRIFSQWHFSHAQHTPTVVWCR